MTQNNSKVNYLPDLIEKTRKSHIEAEKRLLRYDKLSKQANVYYACLTVLLSLLSFCFPQCQLIAFLAIGISVTLTIIAVFASMQNFGSRAIDMKYSYLSLQELWFDFDNELQNETLEERADRLGREYVHILQRTENHTEKDYERIIETKRQHNPESCDKESLKKTARHKSYAWEILIYGSPLLIILVLVFLYQGIIYVCI